MKITGQDLPATSEIDQADDLRAQHWQLVAGRRRVRILKNAVLAGLIVITVAGMVGFWLQLRP